MKKTLKLTTRLWKPALAFFTLAILCAFQFTPADPIAKLDHPDTPAEDQFIMSVEEFKESKGVLLDNGVFYQVGSYHIVKVPRRDDPVEVINYGAPYNDRAQKVIDEATIGDIYYFEKIKAKSEHLTEEDDWLKLNSFVVRIK